MTNIREKKDKKRLAAAWVFWAGTAMLLLFLLFSWRCLLKPAKDTVYIIGLLY